MSELFDLSNDHEPFVMKIFTGEFEDLDAAVEVMNAYEGLRVRGLNHVDALDCLLEGEEITRKQYATWLSADQPPEPPSS